MKELTRILLPVLIFFIMMRFFRFLLVFMIRFWFITIPVGVILYIYFRRKIRLRKEFQNLDPDKEIKTYPEPTIEDDE